MINWQEIKQLHVISSFERIIKNWYGLQIFYTDESGRIQAELNPENLPNFFFHTQMKANYGLSFLQDDIERATNYFLDHPDAKNYLYPSYFPHVKGLACKIELESQVIGYIFAYPFILETTSETDLKELSKKMLDHGLSKDDVARSLESLKPMYPRQLTKLSDLLEFVAQEIQSFLMEIKKRERQIQELSSEVGAKYRYHSLIGKSKSMQLVYRMLEKIAPSESSILIQGSNGTGKELVAKAIHYNSPRKDYLFLAINCSALNDNLLDSELFGHVKGAFTGAIKDKKGLFEQAHGGTLFLDEVGDTSLSMQVKLLRVLQEGTIMPVGETRPRKVDVRIIAATNRPLKDMIKSGEFREDLFYRINVINVNLPDLKDRREDIPLLIDSFLEKRCAEAGMPTKVLSKKTLEKLLDYDYPGNVRELLNEIERLVVLSGADKTILPEYLSPKILDSTRGTKNTSPSALEYLPKSGNLKDAVEQLELQMIREGLKRCDFNKSRLAKELGISRANLIMKIEKFELDKRKKAVGE